MKNEALNKMLAMPQALKRRNVYRADSRPFGIGWMDKMIRAFETMPTPVSITYEASLFIEGKWYDGEIEVSRDGDLAVRMRH